MPTDNVIHNVTLVVLLCTIFTIALTLNIVTAKLSTMKVSLNSYMVNVQQTCSDELCRAC
jgi:hypothetical protein